MTTILDHEYVILAQPDVDEPDNPELISRRAFRRVHSVSYEPMSVAEAQALGAPEVSEMPVEVTVGGEVYVRRGREYRLKGHA